MKDAVGKYVSIRTVRVRLQCTVWAVAISLAGIFPFHPRRHRISATAPLMLRNNKDGALTLKKRTEVPLSTNMWRQGGEQTSYSRDAALPRCR